MELSESASTAISPRSPRSGISHRGVFVETPNPISAPSAVIVENAAQVHNFSPGGCFSFGDHFEQCSNSDSSSSGVRTCQCNLESGIRVKISLAPSSHSAFLIALPRPVWLQSPLSSLAVASCALR